MAAMAVMVCAYVAAAAMAMAMAAAQWLMWTDMARRLMRPCNAQLFPSLHATPASRGRARTTRTPRPLLQRSCNGFQPQQARRCSVSMRPPLVAVHGLGPPCLTAPKSTYSVVVVVVPSIYLTPYTWLRTHICMYTYLSMYIYAMCNAHTCVNIFVRTSVYTNKTPMTLTTHHEHVPCLFIQQSPYPHLINTAYLPCLFNLPPYAIIGTDIGEYSFRIPLCPLF